MESIPILLVALIASIWWIAWLLHEDIKQLEFTMRHVDETRNKKL